jgi:alpha-glucosidase
LYSAFYEASVNGLPVQRSLAIDYTFNSKIYDARFHNQYLFGPSILVAPVESDKEFVKVYFPPGIWYSIYDGEKYSGNLETIVESPIHKLPVFVKGSSMIPMQPPASNTIEQHETIDLHVYYGENAATFELYEDDGSTFDYESGKTSLRKIEHLPSDKKFIIEAQQGSYTSPIKSWKLVLHGFPDLRTVSINGTPTDLTAEVNRFFVQLEKFDPIADPSPAPQEDVLVAFFPNSTDRIEIDW